MALGSLVQRGRTGAVATSVNLAIDFDAADLLICFSLARAGSSVPPVITTTGGDSWTLLSTSDIDAGNVCGSIYQRTAAGSGSETITATSTGATQVGTSVVSISNGEIRDANFNFGTNASGDPSVTMDAYASAASIVISYFAGNAGGSNPTVSHSGFTQIWAELASTNLRWAAHEGTGSDTTTLSWTSPSTDSIGYGIEVVEVSGSSAQQIDGALYTNPNTFHGATVTPGEVTVSGALFTNTNMFPAATVSPGAVSITGGLVSNANTFHGATVSPGAVTISAELVENTPTFFGATISADGATQTITGGLVANDNSFYGATVSPGSVTINGALVENETTFFGATLSAGAAPRVQRDGDAFLSDLRPRRYEAVPHEPTALEEAIAELYDRLKGRFDKKPAKVTPKQARKAAKPAIKALEKIERIANPLLGDGAIEFSSAVETVRQIVATDPAADARLAREIMIAARLAVELRDYLQDEEDAVMQLLMAA